MAYYKISLRGGERAKRFKFASDLALGAGRNSDCVVYYLDHPAAADVVQRAYQSKAGRDFTVEVEPITLGEFNTRF